MSFETLQQPIPSTPIFTPFDYPTDFPHIPLPTTIDAHIHQVFRNSLFEQHLNDLVLDLYLHHTFDSMQFVFAEQIHLLHKARADLSVCLENTTSRREYFETILSRIGAVARDMAHYSPTQHQQAVAKETTGRIADSIGRIIHHNTRIAEKLTLVDFSRNKIETKLLRTILQKTNYYWEYKKVQVSRFNVNK